jgi:PAS domain S-box-containing protein
MSGGAGPEPLFSGTLINAADQLERTREALRHSEQQFRVLVANFPGAVYRRVLDPDMTMEFVSDTIEAITGYAAASLTGSTERTYASIVHPEDRARIADEVRAAVDGERHYGLAYRIVRADGEDAWVGDRGQAVRDGGVVSLSGIVSDITERKQLEADRARIERELRMAQKLEAVGQSRPGSRTRSTRRSSSSATRPRLAARPAAPPTP